MLRVHPTLIQIVTGPAHTVTNAWASDRDVLLTKANTRNTDASDIASIGYTVNALGQRTNATRSGAATNSTAWAYDALGQLVQASDDTTTSNRAYHYDSIGNREKSATGLLSDLPTTPNYVANALNQYTTIPQATATPVYDFDGNMTSGPLPVSPTTNSTLVWDAENRLVSATVNGGTTTYLYDALSRRISKTVGAATTLYIYDGWNCIADYTLQNSTFTLQHSYQWGMDLSGSMQGAGGVGGLLAVTDRVATGNPVYYPCFDGNGNVTEYLNANGTIAAHFEYDPFGNTTVNTDSSNQFAYRFSTKPIDFETGLFYYGYRYYDPVTGRWPSRDPIEEEGGINLYGFLGNDGVNAWDLLGHESNNDKKCRCIVGIVVELTSLTSDQPDLQGHKGGYNYKTGRVYSGTMAVSFNDDSIESWLIHDGGYRMSSSDVYGPRTSNPRGDDAVTPSGDGKVSTKQNDWGLFGFKITMNEMGSRGGILIHKSEGKVGTHGCIGVKFRTDDFIEHMKEHYKSKECKIKDVPIFILYSFSGDDLPYGELGNGRSKFNATTR